jgi:hypothetical protein
MIAVFALDIAVAQGVPAHLPEIAICASLNLTNRATTLIIPKGRVEGLFPQKGLSSACPRLA